jgi:hypothetical protein
MSIKTIVRGHMLFFDLHNTDTGTHAVLRSLAKQLCLQCTSISDALAKLFSEHAEGHIADSSGLYIAGEGADVNTQGESSMRAAILKGHYYIVRLPLENGAGGHAGGVLQEAAHGGHEGIVRLLRGSGADANVHEGNAQVRCRRQYEQVSEALFGCC